MMNRPSERTFQLTFEVGKVPTDLKSIYSPKQKFAYKDQIWNGDLLHNDAGGQLEVYLEAVDLKKNMALTYGVRVICDDQIHEKPPKTIDYTPDSTSLAYGAVIPWDKLVVKFRTKGHFTIEYFFPTPIGQLHLPTAMLKDAVFKDVWVACKDSDDKVHCNKSVICRESQAMFAAFDNETSEESMTKTFTIRHPCATEENVLLFVQCMYEGWVPELMDSHAQKLLILADCYDCGNLVDLAKNSLKRQLTADRFWKTTLVAVLLREHQSDLLDFCANYADALPNGLIDLANRDDCGTDEEVGIMFRAIAALHKKNTNV